MAIQNITFHVGGNQVYTEVLNIVAAKKPEKVFFSSFLFFLATSSIQSYRILNTHISVSHVTSKSTQMFQLTATYAKGHQHNGLQEQMAAHPPSHTLWKIAYPLSFAQWVYASPTLLYPPEFRTFIH